MESPKKPARHVWPGMPTTADALKKLLAERLEWEQARPQPKTAKPTSSGAFQQMDNPSQYQDDIYLE